MSQSPAAPCIDSSLSLHFTFKPCRCHILQCILANHTLIIKCVFVWVCVGGQVQEKPPALLRASGCTSATPQCRRSQNPGSSTLRPTCCSTRKCCNEPATFPVHFFFFLACLSFFLYFFTCCQHTACTRSFYCT